MISLTRIATRPSVQTEDACLSATQRATSRSPRAAGVRRGSRPMTPWTQRRCGGRVGATVHPRATRTSHAPTSRRGRSNTGTTRRRRSGSHRHQAHPRRKAVISSRVTRSSRARCRPSACTPSQWRHDISSNGSSSRKRMHPRPRTRLHRTRSCRVAPSRARLEVRTSTESDDPSRRSHNRRDHSERAPHTHDRRC